ncbi:MAG: asparagine synthase (glutamine-hydrolyzing) [Betaproteobacteria bacterium]
MCGIAGYVNLDGRPLLRDVDAPILDAMAAALHHRGPDDTRSMLWQNVGFTFKRLSIVDIGGGAQPLEVAGGQVTAMVNGEIYNHRDIRAGLASRHAFHTRSDCEVIPHLYLERDLDLFAPVNGMFAVALLDRRKRRVLLARDRLGVKPLFYCVADGGRVLVFASELKGLFAHPAVPRLFDWHAALADAASGDHVAPEHPSGFKGIDRVPAASIVDIDLDRRTVETRRYWSLPSHDDVPATRPASHYVDGYRALLEDSVKLRLMSDVGYGLFLSGGIDSAAIAALAARDGAFPTFSIRSASTEASGDAAAASDVAAALCLPNHQLEFDEASLVVEPGQWRSILWACELHALTAEQLFKFRLHAFARRRCPDLKVMLLGQGSDEFNGGYISHVLRRDGPWRPDDWHEVGRRLQGLRAAHAAAAAGVGAGFLDLFGNGTLTPEFAAAAPALERETTWTRYVRHFRRNLDYHLWHEDRTSAAHSIENRVPFVDYRLVEFVARIPEALHPRLFVDKQILRDALVDLLPQRLAARPKGYFFYGKGQAHAFRMMCSIVQRNGGELVEQAIAGSARTGGPLDAKRFRAHAAEVARDPDGAGVTRLLWLVNMGLLADMADRSTPATRGAASLPAPGIGLADRAPRSEREPASHRQDIGHDTVVALVAGVTLTQAEAPVGRRTSPVVRVVAGARSSAIDSPMWGQFLLLVDGKKTFRQIVSAGHLNASRMRKCVRRAFSEGILEVPSPSCAPPVS